MASTNKSSQVKLTLYVDEETRVRIKTAATHSGKKLTTFLSPFIQQAVCEEEDRMRENLMPNKP